MLPAPRAQKLSTQMNAKLVMCQKVFGQHADRMVNPVYGMSLNGTFPLRVPPARRISHLSITTSYQHSPRRFWSGIGRTLRLFLADQPNDQAILMKVLPIGLPIPCDVFR